MRTAERAGPRGHEPSGTPASTNPAIPEPGVYRPLDMAASRMTYADVRAGLPSRALRRTFTSGTGAQLAFVWVLGAGALLTIAAAPLLAGVFTAACALLAIPIAREGIAKEAGNAQVIDSLIAERFPTTEITDPELTTTLARSRRTLVEMATRIGRAERRGQQDSPLLSVFADASELHALQLESAHQAEDLDRIVDFIVHNDGPRARGWAGPDGQLDPEAARRRREERDVRIVQELRGAEPRDEAERLRHQNLRAVLEESRAARETAGTIAERLETMLLQGFQVSRDIVDMSRAEAAATESREAVQRLQDVVDARRRAAARLGDMFSTDRPVGDAG